MDVPGQNKIKLILDIKDISCDIATDMLMIFFSNKRINGIVPRDYKHQLFFRTKKRERSMCPIIECNITCETTANVD